ncbi:hypothetical protein CRX72_24895 [Pantoea sp. BRM17]|nr:hypothetical protein CRX72_24895 [Pantoea sp. BRM17]
MSTADYPNTQDLSPPHSEVRAALPKLTPGNALDLGCGKGRNSLYLSQHGFNVTAWDANPASLDYLNTIIATEQLLNIGHWTLTFPAGFLSQNTLVQLDLEREQAYWSDVTGWKLLLEEE